MVDASKVVKTITIQGERLSLSCPSNKIKEFDEAICLVKTTLKDLEKVEGGKAQQMILGMLHLAYELQAQNQELDDLKRDIHVWMSAFKSRTEPFLEKKEENC